MSTSRGCTIIFVHITVILPHSPSHSSNKNPKCSTVIFSCTLVMQVALCFFLRSRFETPRSCVVVRRNFSNQNKGHLGSRETIFSMTPSERCVSRFMSPCKGVLCAKHSPPLRDWKLWSNPLVWMWCELRETCEMNILFFSQNCASCTSTVFRQFLMVFVGER